MSRIVIAGGPQTGKTTLATLMANASHVDALHTDDLQETHSWVTTSQAVCHWFDAPGPWLIEGQAVSWALRKWHNQHPGAAPPIDQCIYLSEAYGPLTEGQEKTAVGVAAVHGEIAGWLSQHGING